MSEVDRSAYEEGVNARLSALEFLMEGLWSQAMAALPPEQAKKRTAVASRSLRALGVNAWKSASRRGSRSKDHRVMEAWVEHMIDRIRATEQLLRSHRPSSKNQ